MILSLIKPLIKFFLLSKSSVTNDLQNFAYHHPDIFHNIFICFCHTAGF